MEGGIMQHINGRLYPPLQYVSVVDESTAFLRVLCLISFLLFSNYTFVYHFTVFQKKKMYCIIN